MKKTQLNAIKNAVLVITVLIIAMTFTACDPNGGAVIETYTITFNANGGSGSMNAVSAAEGDSVTLPACSFTNGDYYCSGWAASSSGSVEYTDGAAYSMGSSNITLYAVWKLDYTSKTIGTLTYVPAGKFQRHHTDTNISVITKAYRMAETEVTREQFLAVMGTDPSSTSASSGTSAPVQSVNWYAALAFCNKLSINEGLSPVYSVKVNSTEVDWKNISYSDIPLSGNDNWNAAAQDINANGYRLPTEMEWMWAAMGADKDSSATWTDGVNTTGHSKPFAGSNGSNSIGDYAWYRDNCDRKTQDAGTKTANELGIHDISGNVLEWCWDRNGDYPAGTLTDYDGASTYTTRVIRGGDYYDSSSYCSLNFRNAYDPDARYDYAGFRVVRR